MFWTVSFRSLFICHNDERLIGMLHERYENTVNWNYMRGFRLINCVLQVIVATLGVCLIFACERLPNPKFSYLPRENTEAGDSIWFTNLSRSGDQFSWNFGDGNSSVEEDPSHLYTLPGAYEVILTARNDAGEESFSQLISVKDPTVLGFIVSDSSGTVRLKNAEVWVYADSEDMDKLYNPHFHGITDKLGAIYFHNAEPRTYHIQIIQEDERGQWAYRGFTSALHQNKVNLFTVACLRLDQESSNILFDN
jgi:hypothetical protein